MTENEAKFIIIENRPFVGSKEFGEAISMAIQALEEIQAYRAIGTVEEIRFMKSACEMNDEVLNGLANSVREKMKYEAIGTVEEFKALKDKAEPKKPITYTDTNRADCPICKTTVRGISRPFGDYCARCGQKLDWSER